MKKRVGFVSNSSSTSFIIGFEGVDASITESIKKLLVHKNRLVWDESMDDYVESTDKNSIRIDVDNNMDLDEIIDLDYLKSVGCTTEWCY